MKKLTEGPAKKLSAYISEHETYDGKPLYEALVEASRAAGCAGSTVLRGVSGYGATSVAHGAYTMRMSEDLPVVVVVIDVDYRITALAEVYRAMVGNGLITIEDAVVLHYQGGASEPGRG